MSKIGEELVQSMAEALAHSKGKRVGRRTHKIEIKPDEIQDARNQSELWQDQLGDAVGVSASKPRK